MWKELVLDDDRLQEIAVALMNRIREGLEADHREIPCLPTYLPVDSPDPRGEALVLDLGGTHLRAARMVRNDQGWMMEDGPAKGVLAVRCGKPLHLEEFLEVQVNLLRQVAGCGDGAPSALPLGYCFSYPAASQLDGDAKLLRWTKEVDVPGVQGRPVGKLLLEALQKAGVACGSMTVINDTVAALLAGMDGVIRHHIGLIVGTGTNMACVLPVSRIPKLPPEAQALGRIPVNLESGGFCPPHLTNLDHALDRHSDSPGTQRFEKAVSGAYLGHLLHLAHPEFSFDPALGAEGVARICHSSDTSPAVRATALALLNRSADLVAASLSGLIQVLLQGENEPTEFTSRGATPSQESPDGHVVRVVAEGGLFWGARGYASRVATTLQRLLQQTHQPAIRGASCTVELQEPTQGPDVRGASCEVELVSVPDANLRGTAQAALLAESGRSRFVPTRTAKP